MTIVTVKTMIKLPSRIINEEIISDTHLRMLVNQVQVHQNKDKLLDIKFRMNRNWSSSVAVYVEPENKEITC